jgi:hypothetical protein
LAKPCLDVLWERTVSEFNEWLRMECARLKRWSRKSLQSVRNGTVGVHHFLVGSVEVLNRRSICDENLIN